MRRKNLCGIVKWNYYSRQNCVFRYILLSTDQEQVFTELADQVSKDILTKYASKQAKKLFFVEKAGMMMVMMMKMIRRYLYALRCYCCFVLLVITWNMIDCSLILNFWFLCPFSQEYVKSFNDDDNDYTHEFLVRGPYLVLPNSRRSR